MRNGFNLFAAVTLLGLTAGALSACESGPYDTSNCRGTSPAHCPAGLMSNYDSYNWWKTDDPN